MLYIGRRLASRLGRGLASVCEGHSSLTHGPYFSPPPSLLSTLGPLLHRAHYNTTATTTSTTMAQVAPIPKSKVELHVHLDGAIRPETAFEFAVKRSLKLPAENVDALKSVVHERSQGNLVKFLQTFSYFLPSIAGSEEAIERMAFEFCEDCSVQDIVYVEARYSPHFLSSTVKHDFCAPGSLTPERVVQCVNAGFKKGGEKFGVNVKSILCCMRTSPEWSDEILSLAKRYMSEGVVGIDLAGDERFANPTHEAHIKVFQEAKNIGLCRTVHAGENGGAANVKEAIDLMHAQRLGHGYHALDDEALYARCRQQGVHFEQCPYSSYATGSVDGDPSKHPLVRFVADGASFSINTDDPMVTGRTLCDEYELVRDKMGLGWAEMTSANINAAKACFLPEKEKKNLINQLQEGYKKQEKEGSQVVFGLE